MIIVWNLFLILNQYWFLHKKTLLVFLTEFGAEKGTRTLTSNAYYPLKIACLPVPPFLRTIGLDFSSPNINLIYLEILYIPFFLQTDMLRNHLTQFLSRFQVMSFQLRTLPQQLHQMVLYIQLLPLQYHLQLMR